MSEAQRVYFKADGEIDHLDINLTVTEVIRDREEEEDDEDGIGGMGWQTDAVSKMQQARQMIRAYTAYALSFFKDFGAAEIEEVTLKFGLKLGGKTGIPYITEGSAESNLEIEVKCKFPDRQTPGSTQ